jgi:hypothetical protein
MNFAQLWDTIEYELNHHNHNMRQDRPYNGQSREATEIKGITFRDLRDCFIRAVVLSSSGTISENLWQEAYKGENAALCENDLYGWDFSKLDPMAIAQNLSCEIEKIMGISPNTRS